MASPTAVTTPVAYVSPTGAGLASPLIYGNKWGASGYGTGATVTYSFPVGTASFSNGFGQGEWGSWYPLSSGEQTAVRAALDSWASVANLRFVPVADNQLVVGEMRFAFTDLAAPTEAAHAYFPDAYWTSGGDVWLNPAHFNTDQGSVIARSSFDFGTLLHEIGHALGLKHPFEGSGTIDPAYDSYFSTILSYTASPWSVAGDNFASFYPTTPMYYDLLAIQALYGRNPNHNSSNTVYTYRDGQTYFQTIDDAGGIDKIVYSGADAVTIDLRVGYSSTVSEPIRFTYTTSRATVWIGPGTIIENATGGRGNDTLIGNGIANALLGGEGTDKIAGSNGNDTLRGGEGNDKLYGGRGVDALYGDAGADRFYFDIQPGSSNVDSIKDFTTRSDTLRLDTDVFTALAVGRLVTGAFGLGTVAEANEHIVYDAASNRLLYDPDGAGGTKAVLFAKLTDGHTIGAFDIIGY